MDYAAQGRGWQGHISFKKVSLAKDTTLMGILWPWDSLITQVNSLDRDKWLSAVRCLYWISSKGSGYPAYTRTARDIASFRRKRIQNHNPQSARTLENPMARTTAGSRSGMDE